MKRIAFKDLILHEDEDYLLINKPPFVSTLDDRVASGRQNIIQLAREYHPDIQVAHRIDRETSGILALAKKPEAYRHLSLQFQNREVKKVYHAISDGLHEFEELEVNRPILSLKTGSVRIEYSEGKESITFFNTLKIYQKHSLIECRPQTGRMHQIRIHLATLSAPITGDSMYGGRPLMLSELKKKYKLKKYTEEEAIMKRFALHAYALAFKGLNGEVIEMNAPYPKDFRAAIRQLEKTHF